MTPRTLLPTHWLPWRLWRPVPMRCSPRNYSQWVALDGHQPSVLDFSFLRGKWPFWHGCVRSLCHPSAADTQLGQVLQDRWESPWCEPTLPTSPLSVPWIPVPELCTLRKVSSLVQLQVTWFSAQGLTGCWQLTCIGLTGCRGGLGLSRHPILQHQTVNCRAELGCCWHLVCSAGIWYAFWEALDSVRFVNLFLSICELYISS